MSKKLIAGNWKMNGTLDDAKALIAGIVNDIHNNPAVLDKCDILVCPSHVHLGVVRHALKTVKTVSLGAQNCSRFDNGAHTGSISAAMLKDAKCTHVILGHSERRQDRSETSEIVAGKAETAHKNGLITIICIGETGPQREEGQEISVVERQLKKSIPSTATAENTVIAYEPVWAIGTGKTATPEDVKTMHAFIRDQLPAALKKCRILYGGSMKPENAKELLATANVDGGLIGGASLKVSDFMAIAKSV